MKKAICRLTVIGAFAMILASGCGDDGGNFFNLDWILPIPSSQPPSGLPSSSGPSPDGSGTNRFAYPSGIFVGAVGKIFVADSSNGRIVRMDDMSGRIGPRSALKTAESTCFIIHLASL